MIRNEQNAQLRRTEKDHAPRSRFTAIAEGIAALRSRSRLSQARVIDMGRLHLYISRRQAASETQLQHIFMFLLFNFLGAKQKWCRRIQIWICMIVHLQVSSSYDIACTVDETCCSPRYSLSKVVDDMHTATGSGSASQKCPMYQP